MNATAERDGWQVRITDDRNRPGHVLLNARRGSLVMNLDRIPADQAHQVDLAAAWHHQPYLPTPRPKLTIV